MKNRKAAVAAVLSILLFTGCRNNGDFIDAAAKKYDAGMGLTDYEYVDEDNYDIAYMKISDEMIEKLSEAFTGTKFEKYMSINNNVIYKYFMIDFKEYANDILEAEGYEFENVDIKNWEEYIYNNTESLSYKIVQIDNILCFKNADGKIVKGEYYVKLSFDEEFINVLKKNNLEGLISVIERSDRNVAQNKYSLLSGFSTIMYGGYINYSREFMYSKSDDCINRAALYLSDLYGYDMWTFSGESCENDACEYMKYTIDTSDIIWNMKVFGKEGKVREIVISLVYGYYVTSKWELPEYGKATIYNLMKSMGALEDEISEFLNNELPQENGSIGMVKYIVEDGSIKLFR